MSLTKILTNNTVKTSSRILVGALFIFSGFVKSVDPTGSSIKFGEYFLALHLNFLEPASMFFAILLCSLEFLVGIGLLFNIKTYWNSWGALLSMAIFTPLTLYLAISNAVADCGCFGDFVKLSNWGTFWKNVVIDVFVLLLFVNRNNFKPVFSKTKDWFAYAIIIAAAFWFNMHNILHSPVIDFRPYKIGTDVRAGMTIPAGKEPDKYAYTYTLTNSKTKAIRELNSEEYLAQKIWEDTTWQITKTSEPFLLKAGYKPPIHDLRIESVEAPELTGTPTGKDVLDSALNAEYCVWMLTYNLKEASDAGMMKGSSLAELFQKRKLAFFCLTASGADDIKDYRIKRNPSFYFYNTDQVTIKTIERANPSFVFLKKGKIIAKWHYRDLPSAEEFAKEYLK
jgi:uncharacterized membrane protein YphA (DoxX/SURF4 family)